MALDPTTGRWTAMDPIGFAAGDANLYRYVGNGPVSFADPLGLWPLGLEFIGLDFSVWFSGSMQIGPRFEIPPGFQMAYLPENENRPIRPVAMPPRGTTTYIDAVIIRGPGMIGLIKLEANHSLIFKPLPGGGQLPVIIHPKPDCSCPSGWYPGSSKADNPFHLDINEAFRNYPYYVMIPEPGLDQPPTLKSEPKKP